jgi:hypothetical protein
MGAGESAASDNQMQLSGIEDNGMAYAPDVNLFLSFSETYAEIESYSDLGYNGGC